MAKSRRTSCETPSAPATMQGRNGGTLRRGNPGNNGGRPSNDFKDKMRELASLESAEEYLERCIKGEFGPKFFLAAYQYVTEQGYGKATAFVEQTNKEPPKPVNPDELRVIYALVIGRRMSIPQAENYIRTHPEEVKEWLAKHAAQNAE